MDKKRYWGITLLDGEGNHIQVRVVAPDRAAARAALVEAADTFSDYIEGVEGVSEKGQFYELAHNQWPPEAAWPGRD